MNVAAIVSELDDHGFEDTSSTRKVAIINDTIYDICERDPWPFLEASASMSITSADSTPTLPTDFRACLTLTIPALGYALNPERLDTVAKTYSATATGDPLLYYFVGNEMRLWPIPSTDRTSTIYYLRQHQAITAASAESAILVPTQHHRMIVLGALQRLYAMEDDPDLAVLFGTMYESRLASIKSGVWKKQYDRPDRVVDLWNDWDD